MNSMNSNGKNNHNDGEHPFMVSFHQRRSSTRCRIHCIVLLFEENFKNHVWFLNFLSADLGLPFPSLSFSSFSFASLPFPFGFLVLLMSQYHLITQLGYKEVHVTLELTIPKTGKEPLISSTSAFLPACVLIIISHLYLDLILLQHLLKFKTYHVVYENTVIFCHSLPVSGHNKANYLSRKQKVAEIITILLRYYHPIHINVRTPIQL
jgi:hypothetical protein